MDKWNLFLNTNALLFAVLIILKHHSCYSSVSSVKKRSFTSIGQTILSQAAWFFFSHFMSDGHIFLDACYVGKDVGLFKYVWSKIDVDIINQDVDIINQGFLFNRVMRLFEMLVFIIRIIWILSNIWIICWMIFNIIWQSLSA